MRVLHVIAGLDPRAGGPSYALRGLAAFQQRAGLSVSVVAGARADEGDRSLADQLRAEIESIETIGPCRGPLATHPEMRAAIEGAVGGADVCHVHGVWLQIQHEAALACTRRGVPYIVRPCGMLDPWCLAQGRWKKRLYMFARQRRDLNGAAAMHFTTATERRLVEPLGLRPPSIVEPNGIDLAEFAALPPPGQFRAAWPQTAARPIVLFLSRVHPKKGLDLLLPAFARADRGDAMLVVAGPEERGYLGTCRATAAELGIERDVVFTGMLHGAARLAALVDAALFVLPSYQENFGVAVVEALAAGVPVVISDQVNIHEEITAAGVGAVVPTRVEPLAQALGAWLRDEALRSRAGAAARELVRERYDWGAIAERWVGHYERIAG